ncbi:hypothetical protein [Francisella sp. LA112445]|jgi:hypothetical protein|uniref:hypothetical protein n=1 Tax=Francisella sp. LA112445 TaxID=1395624 RepID=UPI001788C0B3|nr:hypothetical protein [Francisella sp. LA112445]QIW11034.1 hypothetical protein FIP56_10135 [Francisella sp. LA112445]
MKKYILTLVISLASLLLISTNTFADASTVNNCSLKKFQVVQNLYLYLNSSKFNNPKIKDFKKFFNPNVTMTTDDVVLATGYDQFEKHFVMLNKGITEMSFSNFRYLSQNNHNLIFKYNMDGKYKGADFKLLDVASFDFDNKCRIVRWNEVAATNIPLDINSIKVTK